MNKLKEKAFSVNVDLNEKYPDVVQTMLEHLYNNGSLRYDNICLSGTEVVSEKYYEGLTYGNISNEALADKKAMEKDGYHLDFIFAIVEKQQDPFIDCFGHRPEDYCILEDVHYALKLKFSFTRLEDVPGEGSGSSTVSQGSKDKAEQYILGKIDGKYHKRKRMISKVAAPF